MNTIPTTAFANTIVAIDLGKYKSVVCIHDQGTGEIRFTTLDTSRGELAKLLTKERAGVVIIEACLLAGWVHDLCAELGVCCLVANTASEAWKFKHLKRKTDKDDALRLAQLYALGQLPTVTLPPTNVRQWRSLIATRQTLVGRRVAVQNHIRALFVAQGLPAPRGAKAWSNTGLAGIATQAKPLADCGPEELWRGLLDLALTEYRQLNQLITQAETRLDELTFKRQSFSSAPSGTSPRLDVKNDRLDKRERYRRGPQAALLPFLRVLSSQEAQDSALPRSVAALTTFLYSAYRQWDFARNRKSCRWLCQTDRARSAGGGRT
jgi:hypothetical protein